MIPKSWTYDEASHNFFLSFEVKMKRLGSKRLFPLNQVHFALHRKLNPLSIYENLWASGCVCLPKGCFFVRAVYLAKWLLEPVHGEWEREPRTTKRAQCSAVKLHILLFVHKSCRLLLLFTLLDSSLVYPIFPLHLYLLYSCAYKTQKNEGTRHVSFNGCRIHKTTRVPIVLAKAVYIITCWPMFVCLVCLCCLLFFYDNVHVQFTQLAST